MIYENKIKFGAIHVHTRDSIFDGVSSKKQLIDTVAGYEGTALAITDHGILYSCMDDMDYAKSKGVKIIYGVEAYVDLKLGGIEKRCHLILLAKNRKGVKAIDQAVTKSYRNLKDEFPVMTLSILKECFGEGAEGYENVVVTSACIQGPIATILNSNEILEKELQKIEKKLEKSSFDEARYNELTKLYKDTCVRLDNYTSTLALYKAKKGRKNNTERQVIGFIENMIKELKVIKKALETKKVNKDKPLTGELFTLTEAFNKHTDLSKEKNSIILKDDATLFDEAVEYAKELKKLFGEGNFFMEVQYHWLKSEYNIFPKVVEVAKTVGIPLVAANDAHMATATDKTLKARKVAQFLRYGNIFEDVISEISADGVTNPSEHLYIKTDKELSYALSQILSEEEVDEAMSNIKVVCDMCENFELDNQKFYPVYDKNIDSEQELRRLAYEGVKRRFPNTEDFTDVHKERLEYELGIICKMGYADYHLIVREFLEVGRLLGETPEDRLSEAPLTSLAELQEWFNENKVTDPRFGLGLGIGEGRGSGAGSLVCYVLGITGIDPIEYNLLFERFLNPARVSMPDIDSDLSMKVRELTITFIKNKFGEAAVCNILTKAYCDIKGGIRDAGRYLNESFINSKIKELDEQYLNIYSEEQLNLIKSKKNKKDISSFCSTEDRKEILDMYKDIEDNTKVYVKIADELCKNVSEDDDITDKFEDLKSKFADNKNALEVIDYASAIQGINTSTGLHAAGVIIAGNGDVSKAIPLKFNDSKNEAKKCWSTHCDMVQAEASGLLKMDLLGLKTLDIITDAVNMIYKNHGKRIDVRSVVKDPIIVSKVIKEIYAKGKTIGIFQFSSIGMQSLLTGMNPTSIEDLIMANAIYRPGPMKFIPTVCDIKTGKKQVSYITPKLEEITKDTCGVMVYQEQISATRFA